MEKQIGPAPDSGSHPSANSCPVLSMELPEIGSPVVFPDKVPNQLAPREDYNFRDLQHDDQQQLLDICSQVGIYPSVNCAVFWDNFRFHHNWQDWFLEPVPRF